MTKLAQDIRENIEFLSTTEGDTIPCISIEELTGILKKSGFINEKDEKALIEAS